MRTYYPRNYWMGAVLFFGMRVSKLCLAIRVPKKARVPSRSPIHRIPWFDPKACFNLTWASLLHFAKDKLRAFVPRGTIGGAIGIKTHEAVKNLLLKDMTKGWFKLRSPMLST